LESSLRASDSASDALSAVFLLIDFPLRKTSSLLVIDWFIGRLAPRLTAPLLDNPLLDKPLDPVKAFLNVPSFSLRASMTSVVT
jgi:hypothetical protein